MSSIDGRGRSFFSAVTCCQQCEVFDHEVGSPTTHRPQRTGAKRDEEDENTEHDAGVSPSLARTQATESR